MPQPTFKIEWDAHEYEHKERSADWFWAVGIISVSMAVAAIIFGIFFFHIRDSIETLDVGQLNRLSEADE